MMYSNITGQTMGTFYECRFDISNHAMVESGIDSLLTLINDVASTYIASSSISQFNQSPHVYCMPSASPNAVNFEKLM